MPSTGRAVAAMQVSLPLVLTPGAGMPHRHPHATDQETGRASDGGDQDKQADLDSKLHALENVREGTGIK